MSQSPHTKGTQSEMAKNVPLTLIVAASYPGMGIGKSGGLPWPTLKYEMGYFSRVTQRTDPYHSGFALKHIFNAVIMGRRTWESIPERFRPLRNRVNFVISSQMSQGSHGGSPEGPYVLPSLSAAVGLLKNHQAQDWMKGDDFTAQSATNDLALSTGILISRTFIVGGASLYEEALKMPSCERVLLTKIYKQYDCDVFFPLNLDKPSDSDHGWQRCGKSEWAQWTGNFDAEKEHEPGREENGICYEFCLYDRPGRSAIELFG